jgi:hypothetical protein
MLLQQVWVLAGRVRVDSGLLQLLSDGTVELHPHMVGEAITAQKLAAAAIVGTLVLATGAREIAMPAWHLDQGHGHVYGQCHIDSKYKSIHLYGLQGKD